MIPRLYSVVVNWNLKEDTLACVESLFVAGMAQGHVIVVDNGSSDGSVEALRDRFDSALRIITCKQNLGFAGGSNLGIEYALGQDADWILVLNNDTYVATTFLIELENAINCDGRFAIIGPVIMYRDYPERIWYFGDRLVPGLLATQSLYRDQRDRGQLPLLVPVDFVSGCGMLIRRDVFAAIGLFDTTLFMYGEDVDFCWRARSAGFHLAVSGRMIMWHKVSASSNRDQPSSRYFRIRNQCRFYRVYARGVQFPAMIGFSSLRALGITLSDLRHGRLSLIRPLMRGWVDGWLNRVGSRDKVI